MAVLSVGAYKDLYIGARNCIDRLRGLRAVLGLWRWRTVRRIPHFSTRTECNPSEE